MSTRSNIAVGASLVAVLVLAGAMFDALGGPSEPAGAAPAESSIPSPTAELPASVSTVSGTAIDGPLASR
jgi:hypothetical protein